MSREAAVPLEATPKFSKMLAQRAELKEHTCPLWKGGCPNATQAPPGPGF